MTIKKFNNETYQKVKVGGEVLWQNITTGIYYRNILEKVENNKLTQMKLFNFIK